MMANKGDDDQLNVHTVRITHLTNNETTPGYSLTFVLLQCTIHSIGIGEKDEIVQGTLAYRLLSPPYLWIEQEEAARSASCSSIHK